MLKLYYLIGWLALLSLPIRAEISDPVLIVGTEQTAGAVATEQTAGAVATEQTAGAVATEQTAGAVATEQTAGWRIYRASPALDGGTKAANRNAGCHQLRAGGDGRAFSRAIAGT